MAGFGLLKPGVAEGVVLKNTLDASLPESWVEIHADNTIVIRTGKCDFGQSSVYTAYRQIVADELDVPFEAITTVRISELGEIVRSEFEDKGKVGAGKQSLGSVEVDEQFFDGAIVSGKGEMVQPDGECVVGQVGGQIGVGVKDLTQERSDIVAAAGHMLAQQRSHARFSAVGNHFESIDEVLALGA